MPRRTARTRLHAPRPNPDDALEEDEPESRHKQGGVLELIEQEGVDGQAVADELRSSVGAAFEHGLAAARLEAIDHLPGLARQPRESNHHDVEILYRLCDVGIFSEGPRRVF